MSFVSRFFALSFRPSQTALKDKIEAGESPAARPPADTSATLSRLARGAMRNLRTAATHRDVRWIRSRLETILEVAESLDVDLCVSRSELRYAAAMAEERTRNNDEVTARRENSESWIKSQRANAEREFWVEQSRRLQNQIQHQNVLMGRVMDHLAGLDAGDGEDVRALLQDISARLREPMVGVADSPRGGKAKTKPEKAGKTARKKAAKKAPAKRGKTKTARKRTTRTKAST